MDACTSVSAIQLVVMAFTFLLAVVSLDVFWVRIPEELHHGDITGALRKRNWLNAIRRSRRGRRRHPASFLGQRLHQRRLLNCFHLRLRLLGAGQKEKAQLRGRALPTQYRIFQIDARLGVRGSSAAPGRQGVNRLRARHA